MKETFVPILCAGYYERFDDAIKLANDIEYGLTAGIFTRKTGRGQKVPRNIQAGVVDEQAGKRANYRRNGWMQPFGGWKHSGTVEVKEREGLIT